MEKETNVIPEKVMDEDGLTDEEREAAKNAGIDTDDPLSDNNLNMAKNLLKKSRETAKIIQDMWNGTREQYKLTNQMMNELYVLNQKKLEGVKTSGELSFDSLLKITHDECEKIFGADHMFTMTIGRADGTADIIKSAMEDYINYIQFTNNLQDVDRHYRALLEMREDRDMAELRKVAESESDPDKKEKMLSSLNQYTSDKCIDWLQDQLSDKDKSRLVDAFGNEKTIDYWISRSTKKLDQLGFNPRTILEISNFEQIHLPYRYHKMDNMLLTFFMNKLVFTDVAPNPSPAQKEKSDKLVAMIMALDGVIRNISTPEVTQRVKNNVIALLEQLIAPVYERYWPDEVIPDIDAVKPNDESDEEEGKQ